MGLLLTFLLFIVIMGVISLIGMKFYVRPKEAIERVAGLSVDQREHIPTHPSLGFREVLQKLGDVLPASPKDVSIMQRRLMRAGFRGPHSLKILYGAKLVFLVILPVAMTLLVSNTHIDSERKIM